MAQKKNAQTKKPENNAQAKPVPVKQQDTWVNFTWICMNAAGKFYFATSPGPFLRYTAPHAADWAEKNLGIPDLGNRVGWGMLGLAVITDPVGYGISTGVGYVNKRITDIILDECDAQNPEVRALIHLSTRTITSEASTFATQKLKSEKFQEFVNQTAEQAKETVLKNTKVMGEPIHTLVELEINQVDKASQATGGFMEDIQKSTNAIEEMIGNSSAYQATKAIQQTVQVQTTPEVLRQAAGRYAPDFAKVYTFTYGLVPDNVKSFANSSADTLNSLNPYFVLDNREGPNLYEQKIFQVRPDVLIGLAAISMGAGIGGAFSGINNAYHNFKYPPADTPTEIPKTAVLSKPPALTSPPTSTNNTQANTSLFELLAVTRTPLPTGFFQSSPGVKSAYLTLAALTCSPTRFPLTSGLFGSRPVTSTEQQNHRVDSLIRSIMTPGFQHGH
ncbi:MAG: hypothetical protein COB66_00820 [Coxiella sp. (in: Bacteria)]|nr:MAG: hypothetical protein COB66_00820 [Coxiella sp. (in: g-proteobacteria)]